MAIQITMTSQVNLAQGVKALIYGKSGMGKTSLCATAPKPIVLSAEKGLLSLGRKNIERLHGVGTPGITYDLPAIEITDMKGLTEAYQWCANPANSQYFDTVMIDSISEIGEKVLAAAKVTKKDARMAYMQLSDQMAEIIRCFRDLPGKHVIMLAKEEWVKDEMTGITSTAPSMPGNKLAQSLPYFFDEVFRLTVGQSEGKSFRYLLTQPDLQSIAKDRSGSLDKMEMPHVGNFINKILQGV